MPEAFDAIYLSPHLDDAVLSCGGQLARRARAGERVLVVTIFAADEPSEGLSELAVRLHGYFGLDDGVISHRRDEDLEACRRLGVEARHMRLAEAIYRLDPDTDRPLYPTLSSLFEALDPNDEPLLADLAHLLAQLPPAAECFAPLTVGNHVDHQLVRRAAESWAADPIYYEDYPYVERRGALARARGPRDAWTARVVPLAPSDLDAKIEACTAYASQIRPLFRSRWRMKRRLRRSARKVGGERLWRRTAGAPSDSGER